MRAAPRALAPPNCLECGQPAQLVQSQRIYRHRPDLWNRPMWLCACGAYTGCHAGTDNPKGRPAAKATRDARISAHAQFDRLWMAKQQREGCSKKKARAAGYKWLAGQLGLEPKDCHIGFMDRATALRVVQVCRRYR
jgi:hypothetical protein